MEPSNKGGYSRASLFQLRGFFERHKDDTPKEVLDRAVCELVQTARPEKQVAEPPPKSTAWVVRWLEDAELGRYVDKFVTQEVLTLQDVSSPPLDDKVLKDLLEVDKVSARSHHGIFGR